MFALISKCLRRASRLTGTVECAMTNRSSLKTVSDGWLKHRVASDAAWQTMQALAADRLLTLSPTPPSRIQVSRFGHLMMRAKAFEVPGGGGDVDNGRFAPGWATEPK